MRSATLVRVLASDEGTFGVLKLDSGSQFKSAELPWRDNARRFSCIPAGEYQCRWRTSPRFGDCYHVEDVPGRSDILIHAANFAGDTRLGFKSDVEGCIALGMDVGQLEGQTALLRSRIAMFNFHNALGEAPFVLRIS